ncbi:hypothetical protein ASE63_23190 [Bosea sp. Root381]|jgi:hypothetical protein|uniref:tripartite tricarboxylate transporter TctB family protein n=1 Tax=Bosea sp. Root381 TaxID=1736524 RepID=UPI0006FAB72B|nr:tripartite tricarboxylate transporter TctB family protein [Bosea sp. Root381]KRE07152.1 hypothetical protein ASE63_23190 [Bosea sp. Root381]
MTGNSFRKALLSQDGLSGLMFMAAAGGFAYLAQDLSLGTALRMGAGYFPLVLSGLLALIGLAILLRALASEAIAPSAIAWRGLLLVVASVLVFGLGLGRLGLGPCVGIATILSAMASGQVGWRAAIALAAGLVLFTWAVFILGLGLPIPMLGSWLS